MVKVWLGLGSNLGNSQQILQNAWETLGQSPNVSLLALSSPYISAPVGMESENTFCNAVGLVDASLDPEALLALLQGIEKGFGREQKTGDTGYQDRLLDLDILRYGDLSISSIHLNLPHPELAFRLFVLLPLLEIDPRYVDPMTGVSAKRMCIELQRQIRSGEAEPQEIQSTVWKITR